MQSDELKRFIKAGKIWTVLFLALFASSYFLGFMPAGTKEAFLSFVRPSGSDSPILLSVPLQSTGVPVSIETWTAPRIIIPQISVDSPVRLPNSKNPDVLNAELLKGVVRWPDSVMPGQTGNVLLFGHSSTLLAVNNNAYRVFSDLKKLKPGDLIKIHSDVTEYVYVVTGGKITKADDTKINLTSDKKLLTLSTCNIIGGKESRYVIEAEFLRSYPLGSQNFSVDISSKVQ